MNTFCPNYHYCFYNIKLFPYLKYIYCPPILFAIFCTFSIFDGQKCPTILGINVIYGNLGMFTVFFRQIMVMWELCIRNVICDYELSGPNPFNTTIKWYWAPEEQPPEPVEEEDEKAGAGTSGAEHSKSSNNNNICPTLRIYGIMDSGQKCCAHIHGFFPYLLLHTRTPLTPSLRAHLGQLVHDICLGQHGVQLGRALGQQVHRDQLLLGIFEERTMGRNMYGFQDAPDHFVRIMFRDPKCAKVCATFFQKEALSGSCELLQPFNAHIPFILQFFIDFALHGMDNVFFDRVYYRRRPRSTGTRPAAGETRSMLTLSPLEPCSTCAVEFDAYVTDIVNPRVNLENNAQFESVGLNFIWEEERRRCELLGLDGPSAPTTADDEPREEPEHGRSHDYSAAERKQRKKEFGRVLIQLERLESAGTAAADTARTSSAVEQSLLCSQQTARSSSKLIIGDDLLEDDEADSSQTSLSSAAVAASQRAWDNEEYRWRGFHADDDDDDYDILAEEMEEEEEEEDEEERKNKKKDDDAEDEEAVEEQKEEEEMEEDAERKDEEEEQMDVEDDRKTITLGSSPEEVELSSGGCSASSGRSSSSSASELIGHYQLLAIDGNEDGVLITRPKLPIADPPVDVPTTSNMAMDMQQQNVAQPSTPSSTKPPPLLDSVISPSIRTPLVMTDHGLRQARQQQDVVLQTASSSVAHLCAMSLELVVLPAANSRRPVADPAWDPVLAVMFVYHTDICNWRLDQVVEQPGQQQLHKGCIMLEQYKEDSRLMTNAIGTENLVVVRTEQQLFAELVNCVLRIDPEFLVGYDTKRYSWGYLFERAQRLRIPFAAQISRISYTKSRHQNSPFRPPHGRLVLEAWWLVRKERPLRDFRFASVVKHLLGRQFPALRDADMARLWFGTTTGGGAGAVPGPTAAAAEQQPPTGTRSTILRLHLRKSEWCLELLARLDVFVRTAQQARVYGIQFEGVLTRGSQFRVESMLLRIAQQRRFHAPSVSPAQREKMASPETIALTMEPLSGIYRDPVLVLDFQSLYPSICIAYNYCFSTCLGKVGNYSEHLAMLNNSRHADVAAVPTTSSNVQQPPRMMTLGALSYSPCSARRLRTLLDAGQLTFAPNGAIFVRKPARHGLVPILLQELLDTRVMVKQAMKRHKGSPELIRLLDARQLALKLIANVTYGYTAANWSGRMPCEEVADAIVATGRETLERAIMMVNDEAAAPDGGRYRGARVIYGDTDSLFVLCKGCTRAEAFDIGQQIVDRVTAQNPWPVKLKLEKVYQPCMLFAKKRYAGIAYESVAEQEGKFDAKGIETVRRDSPLFVSKMIERFMRLAFLDASLELAQRYLHRRLQSLQQIELHEFVCSADYVGRYATESKSPACKIARELTAKSARLEPVYGERLSYVLVVPQQQKPKKGAAVQLYRRAKLGADPVVTMLSCVMSIDDFLQQLYDATSLTHASPPPQLNYNYYVQRMLFPALQRVLQLLRRKPPVRLKWRPFEPRHLCLRCYAPSAFHTFCLRCERSGKGRRDAYIMHSLVTSVMERMRPICRQCVGPTKSVNIEQALPCANFHCPVCRCLTAARGNRMALGWQNSVDHFGLDQTITID